MPIKIAINERLHIGDFVTGKITFKAVNHCQISFGGKKAIAYTKDLTTEHVHSIEIGNVYVFKIIKLTPSIILNFIEEYKESPTTPSNTSVSENHSQNISKTDIIDITPKPKYNTNPSIKNTDNLVICHVTGEKDYGFFVDLQLNSHFYKGLLHYSKIKSPFLPTDCTQNWNWNWETHSKIHDSYFLAEIINFKDAQKANLTQEKIKVSKARQLLEEISNSKTSIYVIGSTGCGKSSLINALLNLDLQNYKQFTEVGYDYDPKTQNFTKINYKYLTIIDTPGLGDSPNKDKTTIDLITKLTTGSNSIIIIVYDASSRDYGATLDMLEKLNQNQATNKYIHVINKIDKIPEIDTYSQQNKSHEQIKLRVDSLRSRISPYHPSPNICALSAGSIEPDFEIEPINIESLIKILKDLIC